MPRAFRLRRTRTASAITPPARSTDHTRSIRSAVVGALSAALVAAALTTVSPATPASAAVDPGTRNLPAAGSTLSFVGQSTPDLTAYASQVLSDTTFPRPSGITFYTNITPGLCTGLTGPCNLNGNINDLPTSLAQYPGASIAVGLYLADGPACNNQPLRALAGRTDDDIAGALGAQYRSNLDTLITTLKGTGRQVFLRVGYEFDGPWNCYNNEFYVQAFRYVKQRIDALGATKVATVWQSATYPQDGNAAYHQDFSNPAHLDAFYPGDAYVDWIGMSTFAFDGTWRDYQWATRCNQPSSSSPNALYDALLGFASAHAKPVMIAEAAPAGYRTKQLDGSCLFRNDRIALPGVASLSAWYTGYFDYIAAHSDQIRAAAYINADWEAISQFACPPGATAGSAGCTDGYWGNSRIQDNPTILALFKTRLAAMMGSGGSGGGTGGGTTVAGGADLGDGLVRRIKNVGNGLCWDVAGVGTANGVALTQWTCLEGTTNLNQDWKLKRVSTASGVFYQLVAQHSGRCADVSGINVATGTNLLQWDCQTSPDAANLRNQLFALRPATGGAYTLVAKHSGLCVDVPNGVATLGTQLRQWTCNGAAAQAFTLVATSHPSGGGTGGGTGSAVAVPGVVATSAGTIGNGTSKSWALSVPTTGRYKVLLTSTSSSNSQLVRVALGSTAVDQAIDAGQTLTVYVDSLAAGAQTLTVTAKSGAVSVGKVEVQTS